MIYTDLTKKALLISFEAHKNMKDKSGMPYVYHPFHVAEQMNDEYSVCVALLHDVVEDSGFTLDDLREAGFPDEVVNAVALMTHGEETPYFEYIEKLADDPIARRVKLADLEHNSDLGRLDTVDEAALMRVEKYRRAKQLLLESAVRRRFITVRAQKTPCCSRSFPLEYSFCPYCGRRVEDAEESEMKIDPDRTVTLCGSCGRTISMDEVYCGFCGEKSGLWSNASRLPFDWLEPGSFGEK